MIIPQPLPLLHPPPAHLIRINNPVRRLRPVLAPDPINKRLELPLLDRHELIRVRLQVGKRVGEALPEREDEAEGDGRGRDAEHRAAGVDDADVPGLAAVVAGLVGADEGLGLVLVDQVQRDGRVEFVEGVGADEEVEDGREDGHGARVGGDLDTGEKRVAEYQGHAEVADVAVLVGPGDSGVFAEGLTAAPESAGIPD